jgi:hypothetical protein
VVQFRRRVADKHGRPDRRGATLDLNGANQMVASLADSGGTGGLVTNSAAGTLTFTLNPAGEPPPSPAGSMDGGAGNAITLVKSGAGTQVLAGDNTFSGGRRSAPARCSSAPAARRDRSRARIANEGTAGLQPSGVFTNAGVISGSGDVVTSAAPARS